MGEPVRQWAAPVEPVGPAWRPEHTAAVMAEAVAGVPAFGLAVREAPWMR